MKRIGFKAAAMMTAAALAAVVLAPVVLHAAPVPVDKEFNYAEALFDAQEYDYALEEYSKVINNYPENEFKDDAQMRIGECLIRASGDGAWFAMDEWKKLVEKYPGSPLVAQAKANTDMAKLLVQKREMPRNSVEDKFVARQDDFGDVFKWSCVYLSGDGSTYIYTKELMDIARGIFEKNFADYPKSVVLPYNQSELGDLYNRQHTKKDYQSSIEAYNKVVTNYPDSFYANEALINIASIYENGLGKRKDALDTYQKMIDRNKADPLNYYVNFAQAKIAFYK